MDNKELRDKIISKIPELEPEFWSYYNDALSEINKVVWTRITPNIRSSQPLAFASRSRNTNGVFEIYVNPNIPYEVREPLELHEFGHIIFTHMSLLDAQREIIIKKIMSFWHKFEKHLDDDILKSKEEIKSASRVICDSILNIAMDYEVNSKLFTKDEWAKFQEYASWAYVQAIVYAPKSTEEELTSALEWIDSTEPNKEPYFQGCWPEDHGFPSGLDYRQYIDLMLMQPDNVMNQLKELLKNQKANSQGQSADGSGSDSDEHSTQSNNGKISKEDIDKLRKEQQDTNNQVSDSLKDEAQKEDETEKGTTHRNVRGQNNQHGWELKGHNYLKEEFLITDSHKLENNLLKSLFNKHIINTRQDNMYYYNRRKYSNNLLVSKSRVEELYRPGNIFLLVDCSGSIGNKTISTLIGTVKKVAKKCGPNSRIIWWDTQLAGDFKLKNFKGPQTCGGTFIADGIKYVKENYLKNTNDKLIIISDYQDSLHHWYDELEKIKNDCIGICWRDDYNLNGVSGKEYIKDCCMSYGMGDSKFFDKFMKKLPTTMVIVPRGFEN